MWLIFVLGDFFLLYYLKNLTQYKLGTFLFYLKSNLSSVGHEEKLNMFFVHVKMDDISSIYKYFWFDVLLLITPELGFYNTAQEGCVYCLFCYYCMLCSVNLWAPKNTSFLEPNFSTLEKDDMASIFAIF